MTPEKAIYIADYCLDNTQVREALKEMARQAETAYKAGRESMREEIIPIIFGQCASDNVAQRTLDAIRKL